MAARPGQVNPAEGGLVGADGGWVTVAALPAESTKWSDFTRRPGEITLSHSGEGGWKNVLPRQVVGDLGEEGRGGAHLGRIGVADRL